MCGDPQRNTLAGRASTVIVTYHAVHAGVRHSCCRAKDESCDPPNNSACSIHHIAHAQYGFPITTTYSTMLHCLLATVGHLASNLGRGQQQAAALLCDSTCPIVTTPLLSTSNAQHHVRISLPPRLSNLPVVVLCYVRHHHSLQLSFSDKRSAAQVPRRQVRPPIQQNVP